MKENNIIENKLFIMKSKKIWKYEKDYNGDEMSYFIYNCINKVNKPEDRKGKFGFLVSENKKHDL